MKKAVSLANAIEMIPDGASIMIGGFMGGGSPLRLIDELVRQAKTGLTLICNDTARPGFGIGKLIDAGPRPYPDTGVDAPLAGMQSVSAQ